MHRSSYSYWLANTRHSQTLCPQLAKAVQEAFDLSYGSAGARTIAGIVSDDELESEALKWAEKLAKKSPIAVQIAKTSFYNSEDMDYDKQFAYMNEAFARLCSTDDAKEGVNAFFAKRTPHYKMSSFSQRGSHHTT